MWSPGFAGWRLACLRRKVLAAMDSKIVGRELWKVVRPLLREAGWASFSSRTARKFSEQRIDVVNFQSFNSYLASGIGSTTYSFCVRLGCFFTAIPHSGIKVKNGILMPQEYHCHLRYTVHKKFPQPECARTDVFYVDPEGKYLPTVIEAVRQGLATEGLSWFQRFSDMREVLRTLLEDDQTNDGTSDFGAKSSPARNLYTGYIALSLGETRIASEHLRRVADSSSYAQFRGQIEAQLSALK
jgi:Domain of unknown function (DUF4304)